MKINGFNVFEIEKDSEFYKPRRRENATLQEKNLVPHRPILKH